MGTLIIFPRIPKHDWSPMDYTSVAQSMERLIAEARDFQQLANELPLRVRNKVLRKMRATDSDSIYAPWGGLFPHPRIKREGF
jgi:hypothetical protein